MAHAPRAPGVVWNRHDPRNGMELFAARQEANSNGSALLLPVVARVTLITLVDSRLHAFRLKVLGDLLTWATASRHADAAQPIQQGGYLD